MTPELILTFCSTLMGTLVGGAGLVGGGRTALKGWVSTAAREALSEVITELKKSAASAEQRIEDLATRLAAIERYDTLRNTLDTRRRNRW